MQAEHIVTNNLAIVGGIGGLKITLEEPAALATECCKVLAQL